MDRWASQAPTDGNKLVCSSRNWHQGLVNCDRPILTVGSFFTSVVNYFEIINVSFNSASALSEIKSFCSQFIEYS